MGTAVALALVWGLYALDPGAWPGLAGALTQTALFVANLVVTARSRRTKVAVVRTLQRWLINPLVRLLFRVGLNPLGLAILETRGRVSGQPRRTPVGNGRVGDDFWIIAEHGLRAGYVRNIQRDPHVRIRLRVGWRYRWVSGVAEILPADDVLARQRSIVRWHPLRMLNAMNVRVLGADLLTVRVRLLPADEHEHPPEPLLIMEKGGSQRPGTPTFSMIIGGPPRSDVGDSR
ncbi:deazaflavin-dependent oxidoreductase, nitroreductase family [Jiangella alkaliphila]|uniref:Deazaflavin-dependent oxidoreductase, nitroreductase family n=1 Tax=Jiangella alkaliphila TaxID=419479 RepID=A0A1H2JJT0_9ACTN|nr:deazaflavin-dependent oxidoreductase, nitroreductase family [Jiangella alkaliphila]